MGRKNAPGTIRPSVICDAGQAVVVDDEAVDVAFDDADGAGDQLGRGQRALRVPGRGEEDEVVRPLADDLGVPDGVRAVPPRTPSGGRGPPSRGSTGSAGRPWPTARAGRERRQLVAQPGGDQHSAGLDALAVGEQSRKPCGAAADERPDGAGERWCRRSRSTSSRPAARRSAGGMPSRERNPCMWAAGALRGCPGVDHEDVASGAAQDEGCGESGGAAADDERRRSCSCDRECLGCQDRRQRSLPFPGRRVENVPGWTTPSTTIATALGPGRPAAQAAARRSAA